MADKTAYHPDGRHVITFREEPHTYTDNYGVRYLSGTSVSKPYFPEFDAKSVSEKCAKGNNPKYAGRTPEEIREEWKAEGLRGSTEGDNTHMYAEGVMSFWPATQLPLPISGRCRALFISVDKAADYLFTRYDVIGAEIIIFSPGLGIAGMIDLLMIDPDTGMILILDWKQNKEIRVSNTFQSGIGPLAHLQDTHKNKYALQLSIYQYILIREHYFPNATGYKRALIHLTPSGFTLIPLDYYGYEVKELLKHENRI